MLPPEIRRFTTTAPILSSAILLLIVSWGKGLALFTLLVATPPHRRSPGTAGNFFLTKRYASVMRKTIAVWCRQFGHQTFYATYFVQQDSKKLLP